MNKATPGSGLRLQKKTAMQHVSNANSDLVLTEGTLKLTMKHTCTHTYITINININININKNINIDIKYT